ncbi:MAG: hypothetical protein MOIL_00420 [Candidatus Methanolliviera sp. GoM_oil]|nr:MAG: hypothetical protein MOIL_00420 [Candidatus Methanolliviera sp. GoM_oil]
MEVCVGKRRRDISKQFAQKSKLFGDIKLFKKIDVEGIAEKIGDRRILKEIKSGRRSIDHTLARHRGLRNLNGTL